MRRSADEEPQGLPHRVEISPQIGDVGGEQKRNDPSRQPGRMIPPDIASDAVLGYAADASAYILDGGHRRPDEQHDPNHAVAEWRAGLGVCGDPARIVVGGPGDQTGAEQGQ